MCSPGRPPVWRREHRQRFWDLIAQGGTSELAAVNVGVSQPVGTRWFREAGGMRDVRTAPLSGRYLSCVEHDERQCLVRTVAVLEKAELPAPLNARTR
jgi:hypothetical protein